MKKEKRTKDERGGAGEWGRWPPSRGARFAVSISTSLDRFVPFLPPFHRGLRVDAVRRRR